MLFRSPAYPGLRLQSLAREYPGTISLVNEGRPDMLYIRIQNRDNNAVYFWHGRIPSGPTGQGPWLDEDPENWTAQETTDAESLFENFGERIAPGEIWEPRIAQTDTVYSLGAGSAPNQSHVVVGFMEDQEQGVGSHQERGT